MNKITVLLAFSSVHVADSALRGGKQQQQQQQQRRSLQDVKTVNGECTVANFASAVGGKSTLASLINSANNDAAMQSILDTKCAGALEPQM